MTKDRTFKFAAALLASVGGASRAMAQTCACLPGTVVRNVPGKAFVTVGTYLYQASLDSANDSIFGFPGKTPTVYIDYVPPSASMYYMYASICRESYSGVAAGCNTATLRTSTTTNPQDVLVDTSGGIGTDEWDHYWIQVSASSSIGRFIGLGTVPQLSW